MEHVVFFPAQDGNPAFRRLPSLEDAVRFVEYLRNSEGVTEVSVNALSPVQLTVRTVFRVEVAGEAPHAEEAAEVAVSPVAEESVAVPASASEPVEAPVEAAVAVADETEPVVEVPAQAEAEPEPEPAVAGNGAGDVRSLGFFAG